MKYTPQNEFDKLHGCVIVVIKDNVPHAWPFCPDLIFFEEIKSWFLDRFHGIWISLLREGVSICLHHVDTTSIQFRYLKPRSPIARPKTIHAPFPSDVPQLSYGSARPDRLEISHSDAIARFAPDYQGCRYRPERPSGSVHARLKCLQAIDR